MTRVQETLTLLVVKLQLTVTKMKTTVVKAKDSVFSALNNDNKLYKKIYYF
jgi:hypothetical protein